MKYLCSLLLIIPFLMLTSCSRKVNKATEIDKINKETSAPQSPETSPSSSGQGNTSGTASGMGNEEKEEVISIMNPGGKTAKGNADAPVTNDTPPNFIVSSLQKTACYGECPTYEAKIFSDGRVSFNGIKHVDKMGMWEATIDLNTINSILTKANSIGYFNLSNQYPTSGQDLTDLPLSISSVTRNGQTKTIRNRYDSPKALREFELYLQGLLDNLNWRQISNN